MRGLPLNRQRPENQRNAGRNARWDGRDALALPGLWRQSFERRAGEGKVTLTKEAFLFEGKDGDVIGFDLQTLRLVRLKDVHTVEVTYSIREAAERVVQGGVHIS